MVEAGIIEPSSSPLATPAVLAKKRDGTWCFCVDYRLLNKFTRKDSYPLPHVNDALDHTAGSHWSSSLDLHWQVELTAKAQTVSSIVVSNCMTSSFTLQTSKAPWIT